MAAWIFRRSDRVIFPSARRFEEKNVLGSLRDALLVPQNLAVWTIPHNGLIFASQLNRPKEMEFFYGKLVEVQPGFSD
jgi:hypothetical protein